MVTLSPPEGPQTAAVAVPAAVQPATESVPPARPGTGTGTRQGTSDSAVPHDRVLGFLTQRGQGLVAVGPHHVLGHVAGTGALGTATPGAVPGPCRAAALCAVPCALQALPSCAMLCHPVLCHVPSCVTCLIPCPAGATLSAMPCHAVPHVPPCCHPVSCHTMCHTVPCHFPCCHVVLPSHAVCHTVLSSHPNLSHPLSHPVLSSRAMCLPVLSSHPMPCPTLCCHPMLCHVPQCATIPCHAPPHAMSHIVPMLCSFPPALSPTLSPGPPVAPLSFQVIANQFLNLFRFRCALTTSPRSGEFLAAPDPAALKSPRSTRRMSRFLRTANPAGFSQGWERHRHPDTRTAGHMDTQTHTHTGARPEAAAHGPRSMLYFRLL